MIATTKTANRLAHWHEIDTSDFERRELTTKQMMKAQGVTERIKAENAMLWVGKVNNIRCGRNHPFGIYLRIVQFSTSLCRRLADLTRRKILKQSTIARKKCISVTLVPTAYV